MHVNWFKDPDNVVYCKEEEVLPRLSKELGIGDLAERVGIVLATASGFVMLFSLLVGVATRWLPFMTSAIWSEDRPLPVK